MATKKIGRELREMKKLSELENKKLQAAGFVIDENQCNKWWTSRECCVCVCVTVQAGECESRRCAVNRKMRFQT